MKSLKQLAEKDGVTVVSVIHQPRKFIFDLFDSLILLGVGGHMVYHGRTKDAESYFSRLNYFLPSGESMADWLIDISSGRLEPETNIASNKKEERLRLYKQTNQGRMKKLNVQQSTRTFGPIEEETSIHDTPETPDSKEEMQIMFDADISGTFPGTKRTILSYHEEMDGSSSNAKEFPLMFHDDTNGNSRQAREFPLLFQDESDSAPHDAKEFPLLMHNKTNTAAPDDKTDQVVQDGTRGTIPGVKDSQMYEEKKDDTLSCCNESQMSDHGVDGTSWTSNEIRIVDDENGGTSTDAKNVQLCDDEIDRTYEETNESQNFDNDINRTSLGIMDRGFVGANAIIDDESYRASSGVTDRASFVTYDVISYETNHTSFGFMDRAAFGTNDIDNKKYRSSLGAMDRVSVGTNEDLYFDDTIRDSYTSRKIEVFHDETDGSSHGFSSRKINTFDDETDGTSSSKENFFYGGPRDYGDSADNDSLRPRTSEDSVDLDDSSNENDHAHDEEIGSDTTSEYASLMIDSAHLGSSPRQLVTDRNCVGTKGVTTGKVAQAFEEAKVRRAWLYDEWMKHMANLTPDQKALYEPPEKYDLPFRVQKPLFWYQFVNQLRRGMVVASRNRFSKIVDCTIIVGAVIVITALDGTTDVAMDDNPDLAYEVMVRPVKDDLSTIFQRLFAYSMTRQIQ
jgi:hypothetical protein